MLRPEDIVTCDCCKHTFAVGEGLRIECPHSVRSLVFGEPTVKTFSMCGSCLHQTPKPVLDKLITSTLGFLAKMPGTEVMVMGQAGEVI